MNRPFVYIAGPYRDDVINGIAENIAEARRSAVKCWALGYPTFCPHLNSAFMDGAMGDKVFLDGEIAILEALAGSKRGCVMVLVGDWRNSGGTMNEIERAEVLGVKIYENWEDMHWDQEERNE